MDEPLTPGLVVVAAYTWVLLLGGLFALILELRSDAREPAMRLRPWLASWVDFGLYAWAMIMLTIAVQVLAALLLKAFAVPKDQITMHMLVQGLAFHGTILALILFAYRRPALAQALNPSPVKLKARACLSAVLSTFLSGLFLAMIIGKGWEMVLNRLTAAGLTEEAMLQDMVEVLMGSGISWETYALIFLAVVVAPVSEELVFRMGLYRFLKGRFHARAAMIVSSLLFAMIHFNMLSFIPLFLLGMLLCRAYERSGNIWVPILFHSLFNANTIALILLLEPEMLT